MAIKVLIAGGGIGGLTAALCLQRAGFAVQVFEQAAELQAVGAGVQLGANAMAVLDYLGLSTALEPLIVKPDRIDFRAFDSGEVLYAMPLGQDYQQRYGAAYAHIHRADLHRVLCEAFCEGPFWAEGSFRAEGSLSAEGSSLAKGSPAATAGKLRLGARAVAYREEANGVVLELADGETIRGDLLIAADGIHSPLRDQLLGPSRPRWSGNIAWRGTFPASLLPEQFLPLQSANFVGPGKHLVIYPLRDRELVNFVGIVERPHHSETSWVTKAPKAELLADFAGWHPLVQAVIQAVSDDQCYRWALCDHCPASNWSSERVTLLGDAAHAALPFMASGAAMAMEDGRILQRALSQQPADIPAALQCYQRNRMARTAKVQGLSRRAGRLYHIPYGWLQRPLLRKLGLLSRRTRDFLPAYNANTVALR